MSAGRTSWSDRAPRRTRGQRGALLGARAAGTLAVCVAILMSTVLMTQPPPASRNASSPVRIVAVSDVHGAYDSLVSILKATRLLDDKLAWSGGGATLVVIGDVLDRGNGSRRVLELLMRLEGEAQRAGGRAQL